MSGAEPCTGSKSDGNTRSGLMLPEGAMAIVPVQAGPRSERMSPKRLEATTTSNQSGCCTKCAVRDRKSTRLNSSHLVISYAVFCLKKKKNYMHSTHIIYDQLS